MSRFSYRPAPARWASCATVALLSALAIAVGGCGQEPRWAGPQDPGLSSQAIYEHPQGGFSVALPRTWQGGYRIDAVSDAAAAARQPRVQHVVTFFYEPVAAATPEQPLLTLFVFAHADWAALGSDAATVGTVVAQNANRVIVAVRPGRNPFDPASADARRFDTMRVTDEQLRSAVMMR